MSGAKRLVAPLVAPVTDLHGVGERTAERLQKRIGSRVIDLLFTLPSGAEDLSIVDTLNGHSEGDLANVALQVIGHISAKGRGPHRVNAVTRGGPLDLSFFVDRMGAARVQSQLRAGKNYVVTGKVKWFRGRAQMTDPKRIQDYAAAMEGPRTEAVYGTVGGIKGPQFATLAAKALQRLPDLTDWIPEEVRRARNWPSWRGALETVHNPGTPRDLEPTSPARERLAYDEIFSNQLALALVRASTRRGAGVARRDEGGFSDRALAALPFTLTSGQEAAMGGARADLADEQRMLRLLQGDVGSGKTAVAFLAACIAIGAGGQAAFLAPTEILARQHMESIGPLAVRLGVRVDILTGREKGKRRREVLDRLAGGSTGIVVGTHALLTDDVAFHNLGLAIIDEQHRFGVGQRVALTSKGEGVDVLAMTATPIPRTLSLAINGDMDTSRITGKPAGRKPIDTRVMPSSRLDDVEDAIERVVGAGAKVYWVCPLVDDSGTSDLADATTRARTLGRRLGEDRVGLTHGRMKGSEKDAAMRDFKEGDVAVLVATTVIEVGVNVPEATVMVIEHAERFGLSQLHQLRGRIGRGDAQSTCILLYEEEAGEDARKRLSVMRETEDGFVLAEEDMRLRGVGEALGTRQSGLPKMRLADLEYHEHLVPVAQEEARRAVDNNRSMTGPAGEAMISLLYLFDRDQAVAYLGGG